MKSCSTFLRAEWCSRPGTARAARPRAVVATCGHPRPRRCPRPHTRVAHAQPPLQRCGGDAATADFGLLRGARAGDRQGGAPLCPPHLRVGASGGVVLAFARYRPGGARGRDETASGGSRHFACARCAWAWDPRAATHGFSEGRRWPGTRSGWRQPPSSGFTTCAIPTALTGPSSRQIHPRPPCLAAHTTFHCSMVHASPTDPAGGFQYDVRSPGRCSRHPPPRCALTQRASSRRGLHGSTSPATTGRGRTGCFPRALPWPL